MNPRASRLGLAAAIPILFGLAGGAGAQACPHACVGPPRGAILAAGGGALGDEIYREFLRLAGGPSARIVVIPTAGDEHAGHDGWTAIERLRAVGAQQLEVLHTRSRAVADLEAFAAPLREANGVWLSGGKQWRLVDVYLHTRTHLELQRVLERGGAIGGNSAGASALASFLVRGGAENDVISAPGRQEGFGFLRDVAIDQHLVARARETDMLQILEERPDLLGIGLNEGSALVVTHDLARVIGKPVAIYDVTDPSVLIPLRWLGPGDIYDLASRRVVYDDFREAPPLVRP